MSVESIRRGIAAAKRRDKVVDARELDQILVRARDGGQVDQEELRELLRQDGFSAEARSRLEQALAAIGQRAATVNIEVEGEVEDSVGRYASLSTSVRGLSAKVGILDNTLSLKGIALVPGTIRLTVEGHVCEVKVSQGDTAAQVLEKLRSKLPPYMKGLVLGGEAALYAGETFEGVPVRLGDESAHLAIFKPAALGLREGERPLRVVVTGYGPFMDVTDNPSASLARKLAALGVPGAIVAHRTLEVTQDAVNVFIDEMKASPPDVILSMGVGSGANIEERPENRVAAIADGHGRVMATGPIRTGGPDELPSDLPLAQIETALNARFGDRRVIHSSGFDPKYAPDRSAYLCNFLGYTLADAFGQSAATAAGFVHIRQDTPPEQMWVLLQAVAARQLELRRGQQAPTS